MPPEPQLPNQHKVDGFIPNEQLKLLNSLAMHVWKSRSLERCTSCGRTFHREQLEKHRRACHGGQDFKAFGRSRHSYKSTHQAVKTAADKRAADREWEEPKPLRHGRDRAARALGRRARRARARVRRCLEGQRGQAQGSQQKENKTHGAGMAALGWRSSGLPAGVKTGDLLQDSIVTERNIDSGKYD